MKDFSSIRKKVATLKSIAAILSVLALFCLCSCERVDEVVRDPEVEKPEAVDTVIIPTEVYCSEVPGTDIDEETIRKVIGDSLSHEELIAIVDGQVYRRVSIFNCFERNDSMFYVVQPSIYDGIFLNCLAGIIGGTTFYLSIAEESVTHWSQTCDHSAKAYRRGYDYDATTKELYGLRSMGYAAKGLGVQYASKEYLILSTDTVYNRRYEHNAVAQFSRIVYEAVDESEVPDCEIIDER